MRTEKQITASKQNALLSTGPCTEAGRRASSLNSLRHGLASKQLFIPDENKEDFEELRATLAHDYPRSPAAAALIDEVARQQWFLIRANRAEAALLTTPPPTAHIKALTPDEALAVTFAENAKEIAKLLRYSATIDRAFHRAVAALQQFQQPAETPDPILDPPPSPGFAPQSEPVPPTTPGFAPQSTQFAAPRAGFASQNAPAPSNPVGSAPQFTFLLAPLAGFAPQNTITLPPKLP
jgi:hypothetical protein